METMTSIKQAGLLVAVLVFAVLGFAIVSASERITSIEVNGLEAVNSMNQPLAVFDAETLSVKVSFITGLSAKDVRVKAWISGHREFADSTERFDVLGNRTYTKSLVVRMPTNLKDLSRELILNVVVESESGLIAEEAINLAIQRQSYAIEILDVNANSNVKSGDTLVVDVVLKNRGSHFAEDNFVVARIPELGISERVYFGDMSSLDQANPNKEDAVERRILLKIPSNAQKGVYTLEVQAFNSDSVATATKKIAVASSAVEDSMVVSSTQSKTFAPGEKVSYALTIVNSGSKVMIYNIDVNSPQGLSVEIEEPIVVVPAGISKTVKLNVVAANAGKYAFTANINSGNQLVKTESFTANVEGTKVFGGTGLGSNTTLLLTVVLAIIFVVLLVVLIVLLTRKPEKTEEFGESYY